jgi:P27 family predicted phage terminase small subunit
MGSRGPVPRSAASLPASTEPLLPPPWLPARAAAIFAEVEPRLRAGGRLRPEHAELLGQWACTAAELRRLAAEIDQEPMTRDGPHGPVPTAAVTAADRLRGRLAALGARLGLDPAASARIGVALPRKLSPVDEWRARHSQTNA